MIEMRIYGIVPGEGPQVCNIAPNLIAEILDGCIPQSSSEFRDVYAAWMDRYAPGAMPPEEYRRSGPSGSSRRASCTSPETPL